MSRDHNQPITAQECHDLTNHTSCLGLSSYLIVVTRRQLKPEQSCKTKFLVCVLLAGSRDS